MKTILYATLLVGVVSAFGGSEDRFVKKYAMMKIYESCFGSEVVKLIRREMKMAVTKCAAFENPAPSPQPQPQGPLAGEASAAPGSSQHAGDQQIAPNPALNSVFQSNQPTIDVEKLHQAILAYRPNNMAQTNYRPQAFSPQSGFPSSSFYTPMAYGGPGFQNAPGYPFFYPGYQQVPFSPYSPLPIVGQQFYGNNRMSRDLGIKGQIEVIASSMSSRVKNVTCVMQELGYLDENLEPNFSRISERIGNLPVDEELKRDMQDGLVFCQQFSQCVPEVKKDKSPLSRELIRPMFFFKCYKHKKLEACIMKDVREKYSGVAEDEEFEGGDLEVRRSKSVKFDSREKEMDELASSMYDFLYASDANLDLEAIL